MRKILVFYHIMLLMAFASVCYADENHHPLSVKKEKLGLGVGLGVHWGSSEYKGKYGGYSPLPALTYDSEYAYIRGLNAGVHLFKNKRHEFNVQLTYLSQSFSPDSSDDSRMKKLDERYPTLGGGVSYIVKTRYGVGQATITSDLSGMSNGIVGILAYVVPWHTGKWDIIPSVGIHWTDYMYNKYYYGVGESESRRSGLKEYDPGCAFSPGAQLIIKYNFTQNWNVFAHGGITWLGAPIQNSPMVDSPTKTSFSFGVLYEF